jgi:hypothetical protein
VTIHQMQVAFDAHADRLLLRVRTTGAELYAVWLTRRMVAQMLPHLRRTLARTGVAAVAPQALPVPEARQMLEQAVLQRPLPGADFQQPFADGDARLPLGPEPLLPAQADMTPLAGGALQVALADGRGQRIELNLPHDTATALLRLVETALAQADWNLGAAPAGSAAAPQPPADAGPPRLLN